ncbi:MAG: DUF418 domain-containing protein [Verrucomicrobiales bacterium]|nr:DUF418 domain-containing protein [Verrucomicrobiales bacterium]
MSPNATGTSTEPPASPLETQGSTSPRRAVPVDQASRIQLIDILRGVALLGILLMNIPGFALPAYFTETFKSNPRDPDFWLHAFITVFFEGKMRALFGMVFGAGIVLFVQGKERAGAPTAALFYRRMAWLVLFGLLHAHLILWVGDILYLYGLCGMLVYPLRKVAIKYLILAVPVVALLDFVVNTAFYQQIRNLRLEYVAATQARDKGADLTPSQTQALEGWRELEKTFIPNRDDAVRNAETLRSGYSEAAAYLRPIAWGLETRFLPTMVPDSLALMLFGVALLRVGFLTGEWQPRNYRRTAWIGYGLGLPLVCVSVYFNTVHHPNLEASLARMEAVPIEWTGLIYPFQRILIVMAHVSSLVLMFKSGVARRFLARLGAVGQMAFTNYIMQSVLCTLVFFGYGLGYHGRVTYAAMYLIAISIWVFQLVASPFCLARFRFGPLEWLWRTLTYLKAQPFKR